MDLPKLFETYLKTQNASIITTKNYLADFRHFLAWFAKKTGIHYQVVGKSIFLLFNQETIEEYKTNQIGLKTPSSTINRRLSALRKVAAFARSQAWLAEKSSFKVSNVLPALSPLAEESTEAILEQFRISLTKEKVSPITAKNYLSDIRDFLGWLKAS